MKRTEMAECDICGRRVCVRVEGFDVEQAMKDSGWELSVKRRRLHCMCPRCVKVGQEAKVQEVEG